MNRHQISQNVTDRALNAFAATLRLSQTPVEYFVDDLGRTVRKPTKDRYVTTQEVVYALSGQRVVDIEDMLYLLGATTTNTLIKQDKLRKDPLGGFYWITAACAKEFGLPPVMGCKFPA